MAERNGAYACRLRGIGSRTGTRVRLVTGTLEARICGAKL